MQDKKHIYESPDGGKTIYAREIGAVHNNREMIKPKKEKQLKRIENYDKTLPVLELYRCVQSEGSRFGRPTIAVRTTGCTHRCYFGEGGWCDSWYTSIHPEKGTFNFNDIIKIYDENPHIKEMMLTGGSPTMHPALVNELTHFANERGILITIETEGSHFLSTDYPIGLISLSPKFSNSVPVLGAKTPSGKETDKRMIKQHNKLRMNYDAMHKTLDYHTDYHFKPVWDGTDKNLEEIEAFRVQMDIPKHKTYIMPAGDTRKTLIEMYPKVFRMCEREGYNMTGRDHIIAFDTERGV
jgi:7-carboxy-7-deazaguanine synthase